MSDTLEQLNTDKTRLESEIDNLRSQLSSASDKLYNINREIANRNSVGYLGLGELAASVRSGKLDGDIDELVKRTFIIRDLLNSMFEARIHYENNKTEGVDCLENMKSFVADILYYLRSLEEKGVFGK